MNPVVPLAGAAAAALSLSLRGALDPNSSLFGPVISRGSRDQPVVYLSFDDGPNPETTPRVLETLGQWGVPAAFFLVGRHAELFPDIARRVAGAGHDLGNHTHRHRKLHLLGPGAIHREVTDAHRAIAEAAGVAPTLFRAPHGYRNPFVAREARRLGYVTFGWTGAIWDSARPGPEEIRRRVGKILEPGVIFLLHDGNGYDPRGDRTQTAAALPGILADARDRGFRFGRLSALVPRAW